MKAIIVTGGAGFIGRNLVEALNRRGEDNIYIVDKLGRDEKWRNLLGLAFEDAWGIDDFRRRVRDNDLPPVATIFHLGACSATTEADADYLLDNNYRTTRELCEWSLKNGVRFIYASSAATYGAGEHGYDDSDDVTPLLRPLNMYGYSKHMFDLWALRRGHLRAIAGVKYFNVFGPGEDHKGDMRSVINKAVTQIVETGKVQLFRSHRPDYKDGEQLRDFVYVKDAVAQTLFYHDHPEVSGLFNAGTGRARSWNDLARAVFAALGREPVIEYIDMPETIREKYQYYTKSDTAKARAAGYTREAFTLEDAVRDYVVNYLVKPA
ncbi:ADP-glyceromanno-heptose 6-epimerase [Termitidicoccus mucosus]|uniref:ADP-L-glycero-D-manno-heptose-6-epimerase n=1 Tax=Termitidicoccus mucosus TaxID=1184151 RepID=A0A178IJY7_9BACT|nr:ADP-L-glycero-D-mannoheptose-6-epimerase [Opitutaceae bacterium TSB47]